jgi:hypothetical protein
MKKKRFVKATWDLVAAIERAMEAYRDTIEDIRGDEEARLENYNEGTTAYEKIAATVDALQELGDGLNMEDLQDTILYDLGVNDFCEEEEIDLWE